MSQPISIPPAEHDNVLYMLWTTTTSLENHCDRADGSALDRHDVTAAYNLLNRLGYTTARPGWERRSNHPGYVPPPQS